MYYFEAFGMSQSSKSNVEILDHKRTVQHKLLQNVSFRDLLKISCVVIEYRYKVPCPSFGFKRTIRVLGYYKKNYCNGSEELVLAPAILERVSDFGRLVFRSI